MNDQPQDQSQLLPILRLNESAEEWQARYKKLKERQCAELYKNFSRYIKDINHVRAFDSSIEFFEIANKLIANGVPIKIISNYDFKTNREHKIIQIDFSDLDDDN